MIPEVARSHALYLAIDQGGHGSRALAFNSQGQVVAKGVHEFGVSQPYPNWVEQDPDGLVSSVSTAVTQVVDTLGGRSVDIVAAGLATQRSTIACWDKESGVPLSPVISWQDRRAHDWLKRLHGHAERIHQITGLFLSAHYGASKLRWCLDNLAEVRDAYDAQRLAWGPVVSFLLFRLLAERPFVADPANASRTLLWSLKTRDWDPTLLKLFGLPGEPLPRCVSSRYTFGTLNVAGKQIPLSVVNGDQSAALFAFGRPRLDTAYINIGTGAFVQRLSDHYLGYAPRLLTSVVLNDGDDLIYALEGTVNGAASALRWLERECGLTDLENHLPEWLAQESSPPLFLNGVSGLGSPYWVPDFPSRFIGEAQEWEKAVAVVESIVFLLQENLGRMCELASPPQQIQITGGLSRFDGLCRRVADLSGLPVYCPAECEATARGTAFLTADCPRTWPETALGKCFEPSHSAALVARYRAWREAMEIAIQEIE